MQQNRIFKNGMAKVLITGGTGIVGRHLCKLLLEKGYDVALLSRSRKQESKIPSYTWNIEKEEIEKEAIASADFIVHLAGANIGEKRWTEERKQLILDSRVKSGRLIFNKVKEQNTSLKAFITASATGYYGALTSDKIFSENDPAEDDFLGNVCEKWEQITNNFDERGIRSIRIRTGLVLTQQGGALAKMTTPTKIGVGSAIGSGNQYMPWIHIDDLCGIYLKAIEDEQMQGVYNAVAPEHHTSKTFMRSLAQVLKKPFWFPKIPSFVMKLLFGKMSEIVLKGSRVSSEKITSQGYNFLFPNLKNALANLLTKD